MPNNQQTYVVDQKQGYNFGDNFATYQFKEGWKNCNYPRGSARPRSTSAFDLISHFRRQLSNLAVMVALQIENEEVDGLFRKNQFANDRDN